ncbi:MAG: choice-of-anchor Q domain-containing protein, partial [Solirubrobacterales bacterium]
MRERAKGFGLGVLAGIAALALPAAAAATPYFAAPSPIGAGNCSTATDACSIYTAKTMASMAGDEVLLAAGTYPLSVGGGGFVNFSSDVTVKPQATGIRPLIASSDGSAIGVTGAGATIQDVDIAISGLASSEALAVQGVGTAAYRVAVTATGTTPIGARLQGGGLLSDSTAWTQSNGGRAIVGGGANSTNTIRNTTAIATGTSSFGFVADGTFGQPQIDNVHNAIFRGTAFDFKATGGAADVVTVNIDHSNYVTSLAESAMSTINDNGGNQSGTPLFAGAGTGDFTQLAGSPTIDKGAAVGGLGPLDFSGGNRVLGLAPDIGADEFPSDAPPQFANAVAATTSTKSKCKKGFKLKTVKNK